MTATRLLSRAARLPRRTLQVQLTLLYSGAFIALVVLVLAAANLLIFRASTRAPGAPVVISHVPSRDLAVLSVVILVVSVVVAVLLGWLIAGRLLARLRRITATARDISAGDLHRRLELNGPGDEFQELGETLDDLFSRLEAAFEVQRHFVANASHELRTPLTAERTLLQVALADPDASAAALRATCQQILQLGEQQERLIDALLTLAASERGIDHSEPFDLGQVTDRVLLGHMQEADRRGLHIDASIVSAPVLGDPRLVESLVANLVDNAVRHNITGGRVEISTTSASGRATISVSNTGPVVAPAEVGRLFQPLRQTGSERVRHNDGHGLGLAIVQAIAQAHGTKVTARARPDGGLEIQVTFTSSNT